MTTVECSCESETEIAGRCEADLAVVAGELREHFHRPEAYQHTIDYLRGLLTEVERKNGWQLAEEAGYDHPRGIQRVLDRYAWDADAVRDDLLRWTIRDLGDPAGVLVVDESGFLKQGRESVGVARQYTGTAGKIANCQIGVFLGYASPRGQVGLDRALYLPQVWAADGARRAKAKVPEEVTFRTKPDLARELVERALDAGVPAAWVTGDEVYGNDAKFRRALEARGQAYVLAVRRTLVVTAQFADGSLGEAPVATVAAAVPDAHWHRLSCGEGSQGPRVYDWAGVDLGPLAPPGWIRCVLVRRHPLRPHEIAYYLVFARAETPLEEMVRAAGTRWTIEEFFQQGKGQVGLDQYEVRSWHGWHRHITLALVALLVLTVGAQKGGPPTARCTSRSPSPRSSDSSSASSGPPLAPPPTSSPGPAGADTINASPNCAIAVAA
jgi:SRSO17 transposase